MRIEDIIYITTREINNTEEKLRIATLFLFCQKIGCEKLSELLYTSDHRKFINDLNQEYQEYKIDFYLNFNNPNVHSAFYKTLEKVREKWDSNGFLKAIYERDEFALVICNLVNYDFNKVEFKKLTKKISKQLTIF
jgi:hypothetical protein